MFCGSPPAMAEGHSHVRIVRFVLAGEIPPLPHQASSRRNTDPLSWPSRGTRNFGAREGRR
ncbi:hypothetical protein SGPA1_12818 [Streptomyces misionensis JCM 4497]